MEELYWIWLSRIEEIGPVRKKKLLEKFKTPKNIYNTSKNELLKIDGIGEKIANAILKKEYKIDLDKYLKYMNKNNIQMYNINQQTYPEKLRNIYDMPIVIFAKGDINILDNKTIAIVGCRECSEYGRIISKQISYALSKQNINIISGLARGIDTSAHLGCLKAKGKTVAIIGNGLDTIYPIENIKIADEIIKNGGLIISEYLPGVKPLKNHFPARNRIISGLSDGVIVVEAKEKSGTLITVDFALEQGKNVYVIPGNINSPNSVGTNELIKQGAKVVTRLEDIMEDF